MSKRQFQPSGAGYGVLPGGDIASHSDTSLKVTVIKSHPAPAGYSEYDGQRVTPFAVAFGPTQENPFPKRWLRQVNASKAPSGVWLDDQLNAWQRTKFDVYVRRDRVIIYVNGEQRICSNLTESPLTMAEAAVGFWHILYHTSAEFIEIRAPDQSSNPLTGQHHILHNVPFGDHRSWDNVGLRENVALPAGFDTARCI